MLTRLLYGYIYQMAQVKQSEGYMKLIPHYSDVIMSAMVSEITGVSIVCYTICSGADQRKHQSSVSLAFVRGIHQWPVDSPHKGPVTRKLFPFQDAILSIKEEEVSLLHIGRSWASNQILDNNWYLWRMYMYRVSLFICARDDTW